MSCYLPNKISRTLSMNNHWRMICLIELITKVFFGESDFGESKFHKLKYC